MNTYILWFYNPREERTTGFNIVNKMIASYSPPYCHVEMQFPNGEATSIVMNSTVSLRNRTFDPQSYVGLRFNAPGDLITNAYKIAKNKHEDKIHFSMMPTSNGTFCTKLIWDILKSSNIASTFNESSVQYLNSYTLLPPSVMFDTLQSHATQITTVPRFAIDFAM